VLLAQLGTMAEQEQLGLQAQLVHPEHLEVLDHGVQLEPLGTQVLQAR